MGNSSSHNNNNNRKPSGKRVIRLKSAQSLGPPRIVEYTKEQNRIVQILKKKKFGYNSLVFGGGGAKGVAYYGALQVGVKYLLNLLRCRMLWVLLLAMLNWMNVFIKCHIILNLI